jgi:23S rRNA pseudouridine1911/1915/1917 synthase
LLRVFPRTGRRHQIRVHLDALGHPILGDLLYGRDDSDYLDLVRRRHDARHDEDGPRRHLLHCSRLGLPDPAGGREIDVVAPLPADILAEIERPSAVL